MTVVSSRSSHTLPAEFGPEPTEGSHKATRHADGVCFLIPSSPCDQHLALILASALFRAVRNSSYVSVVCRNVSFNAVLASLTMDLAVPLPSGLLGAEKV
jgi:hypothetical protein